MVTLSVALSTESTVIPEAGTLASKASTVHAVLFSTNPKALLDKPISLTLVYISV